jgi:hypothetical protein
MPLQIMKHTLASQHLRSLVKLDTMLCVSLLVFALLASASGVPDVSIPAIIVAHDVFSTDAAGVSVGGPHYESPPCGPDEKAVQVMGIDGVFCSPSCNPAGKCPMDVPKGVTAVS